VQQIRPAIFIGGSRHIVKNFPDEARWLAGNEINELQLGCLAKFAEAVYILHAFAKKTQKTPKRDLDIARKAYAQIKNIRQNQQR
jgi:hypothetical protein